MKYSDTMENEEKADFRARPYQQTISEIAYKDNTIIYLPTGSGKTFIAIMLLKRMSHQIIGSDSMKKSVFLVNTVPLVEQHCDAIKRHTYFTVGKYSGEQNCDLWSGDDWQKEIQKHQVLVMTAQIFLDIIRHHYFSLEKVNLLVFDECHQAVADQPMRQLMQLFSDVPLDKHPRVLGLTATLLNGNCAPARVMTEVEKLETTFHSKVATVGQIEEIIGYSTNAEEFLVTYTADDICEDARPALAQLRRLTGLLQDLRIESKADCTFTQRYTLEPLNSARPNVELIKLVNLVIDHLNMCGIFGASRAALAVLVSLEHMKRRADNYGQLCALALASTYMVKVLNMLNSILETVPKSQRIYKFSSDRVLTFINTIANYRLAPEKFCCLVFVQRRFTAKVLYYILKALAEDDPNYRDLVPNFIVGFNAPGRDRFSRENLYTCKQNKKVIQSFKQYETNLLVASSVLEEGVDIPMCSLVIRFDLPMNYRSYMQSKGRARHKESKFIIMVPKKDYEQYKRKYEEFQEIEKILRRYLTGQNENRQAPTQERIERELYDEVEIEPYYVDGRGSAHVSMLSSISLLNRYCQSLHRDKYTELVPNWYSQPVIMGRQSLLQVFIEMPVACPIRTTIKGIPMSNKVSAKRAAALEACKQLHQIGQLNDRLLPQVEELTLKLDFLCMHWAEHEGEVISGAPRPGTNKFIRTYAKLAPEILRKDEAGFANTYYLHIIEMTSLFDATEGDYKLYIQKSLIGSDLNYGLITLKPMPKICDFPVFISPGEVHVHIKVNQKTIQLSEEEVLRIRSFNYLIFHDLLCLLRDFYVMSTSSNATVLPLVPLRRKPDGSYDIAMDYINDDLKIEPVREPSTQTKTSLNVTEDFYVGKVVSTWYRDQDKQYIVSKVCSDMNAYSQFPSADFESFKDYYKVRYGLYIVNPEQPLLLVKPMSKRLNCILPRSATLHSKRKRQDMQQGCDEHLIPELCVLQEFPGSLWYKATLLPTIIHRIVRILQAEQLRRRIVSYSGFGVLDLPFSADWDQLPVDERVLKGDVKKPKPVPNRDVGDTETPALPEPKKKSNKLINKDYSDRMLERLYPWKDDKEPMDFERNIDLVTGVGLEDYERFCNEAAPIQNEEMREASIINVHGTKALTYGAEYELRPIKLLTQPPAPLGVQQWKILQALTAASANDIVNLERLETLGDSFLKIAVSLHLYLRFPNFTEGVLTLIKSRIIGNRNLVYCALDKDLGEYIQATEFSAENDWVPPGWVVPSVIQEHLRDQTISINRLFEVNVSREAAITGDETSIELNSPFEPDPPCELKDEVWSANRYLERHALRDKTLSDSVEAILGAFLEEGGVRGGLHVLDFFDIIPAVENPLTLFERKPPSALLKPDTPIADVNLMLHDCEQLEAELGYTFKDRSYLLQALTHASFCVNRLTDCYQRLEFLGDAVLDFLITCHIYERGTDLQPGQLTDLRSALVNNVTFACLAVRSGFYKPLLYINSRLNDVIDGFVKLQIDRDHTINEDVLTLLEDEPLYLAEQVHVPKVLGDVFESLAGAVFLDTGMDLVKTWEVFHKIMHREIDTFLVNTPRNPVRLLYEYDGAAPQFFNTQYMENGTVMVSCSVMVDGTKRTVVGVGENKKQAKRAAAKMGLNLLS